MNEFENLVAWQPSQSFIATYSEKEISRDELLSDKFSIPEKIWIMSELRMYEELKDLIHFLCNRISNYLNDPWLPARGHYRCLAAIACDGHFGIHTLGLQASAYAAADAFTRVGKREGRTLWDTRSDDWINARTMSGALCLKERSEPLAAAVARMGAEGVVGCAQQAREEQSVEIERILTKKALYYGSTITGREI